MHVFSQVFSGIAGYLEQAFSMFGVQEQSKLNCQVCNPT
jgi:hypothetical protein